MNLIESLRKGLSGRLLFWALLLLNAVMTLAVAVITFHDISGDHFTYLGYTEGLQHGWYTYWSFLPEYLPDTFRNPGYPLFLYLLKLLGGGASTMRLVQVGLYVATIALAIRIAAKCEAATTSYLVRNLFLLLLLPNVQLAYMSAVIYPEILVAFLLAAYCTVALLWPLGSWKRTLVLALLAGLVFQTRPVFLFFPLVQIGLDFLRSRSRPAAFWPQSIVFLALFALTLLPYSLWNYKHHGVFKPTPLEGGGGVMQIGFWALRMPGYQEQRYWHNTMGDEVIEFADKKDVPGYIKAFNQEWDSIDAQSMPYLTARDRRYDPLMQKYRGMVTPDQGHLMPTYSAAYTIAREKALMQANWANIKREPGYYLKTRLYTLVRLWVTGIQLPAWRAAATPVAKLKVLYPTIVSGVTFVLGLISVGWALVQWRRLREIAPAWWLSVLLVVYFGVLHLPFAIQARYTVPVRPWLLLAVALSVATWLGRRKPVTGEQLA